MPAAARDWFVAAEAQLGDGSRGQPFHDPWLALRSAGPGDVIHLAAGTYFGRYLRSSWVVDCPGLTLRGGYSRDFSRRAPWQTPSVFGAYEGSLAPRESNLLRGQSDHSGLILDGLIFDGGGRNAYGDKPAAGVRAYSDTDGALAAFNSEQVTIKNCVFVNSAAGAVELSGDGSHFENNLVLNIIGTGMLSLRATAGELQQPIAVTGNAFCFAHDVGDPPLGGGADNAIGIRVNSPAVIQDNIFLACGNAAISVYRDLDRVSIDRNLFYLTPRALVNSRLLDNAAEIMEGDIDELEDVGLKSAAGNVAEDPGLTGLRPTWLDAVSRYLLANYARPPRAAANALRIAAGLPALSAADLEQPENQGELAPRLAPGDALALKFAVQPGWHPIVLATEFAAQPAPAAAVFRPIDWSAIDQPDPSLALARVELRAGLGFEQNTTLLAEADPAAYMGIRIYRPGSDEGSIFVLARRYTLPARQFEEAIKYTTGREVESAYLLRGVYRTDLQPASRQQATLVVESIVPAPETMMPQTARSAGRDWFVKAGSSGGDGTRAKPFRDPFQALEKAQAGDAIHVAGGDYFGRLRSGQWKLLGPDLTMLGGYDDAFATRDPWKNSTRFVLSEETKAKGAPGGAVLSSDENSDGLILDGFIFDGAAYNTYQANGSLDFGNSPLAALLDLRGGRAPLTVRNCLFINAASAAVRLSCPYGVFENNIVLNASGWSMRLSADGPGPWAIRHNTFLFASDPHPGAGTGQSSADGTLLHLTGRAVAVVEANIFAFADNFGVRTTIPQQNLLFDNNVFAANLFVHLTDAQYLWANNSNWERCAVADSAFAAFTKNTLDLPKLPVDPAFAEAALARLYGLPSQFSTSQWKTVAAAVGASAAPAASASAPATAAKPAQASSPSLDDLLAQLGSFQDAMKAATAPATDAAAAPIYCPAFAWSKALALAQATPATEPGAHRLKLAVTLAAG